MFFFLTYKIYYKSTITQLKRGFPFFNQNNGDRKSKCSLFPGRESYRIIRVIIA